MIAFRCYDPSTDESGGIHAWHKHDLTPTFQAHVDTALEDLALEDDLESAPNVKPLRGACKGLTEVQIDFGPKGKVIHIRILGFEWPWRRVFTMLNGFQKTSQNISYGPHCRSAHTYKDKVIHDGQRAKRCRFP
jgi:hypothetical protein